MHYTITSLFILFRYASHVPEHVDWVRFSDEIESIFTTKELEKAPLLNVEQFKPPVDWQMNAMSEEDNNICINALARLAEKVGMTVSVLLQHELKQYMYLNC